MNDKKETIIVLLVVCIILTPILLCAGIKGVGGLISIWLFLGFYWWILYGKDMHEIDKIQKDKEKIRKHRKEMQPIIEKEKQKYEANLPIMIAERERQRRIAGLVTDSSFKEYMKKFGFDVEGTIDIGRFPTWNEFQNGITEIIYPSELKYDRFSEIKISTHKSMEQLKKMGIYDIKQLLGDYFKYFGFKMDTEDGGFYKGKKKEYDKSFCLVTIDDPNNMCANVKYSLDSDNNKGMNWTKDCIYHIVRRPKEKFIKKNNEMELNKWTPESLTNIDYNNLSNIVRIVYNQYTIFRDSGIIIKDGNFSLTEDEKKFLMLSAKSNSGIIKYADKNLKNFSEHYQISNESYTNNRLMLQ